MKQPFRVATLLLVTTQALGAGFALPEQSARAMGLAGSGTGSSQGASSIFYNPGTLAFEDGVSAEISGLFIAPTFKFEPVRGQDATSSSSLPSLFALPTFFVALPVQEKLQVGVGVFSNFGLGVEWPTTFDGRYESQKANLTTFTANPTVSYAWSQNFGLGVGVNLVRSTLQLTRAINFVEREGALQLQGDAWGVGANVGVSGRFFDQRLTLGASWRSSVKLNYAGDAYFDAPIEFKSQLRDQTVQARLNLPHLLALGGSLRVLSNVRIHVDAHYTLWSAFDELRIQFAEDAFLNQVQKKNWQNTFTVRGGAEWSVTKALTLRVGAGTDASPSPSSTLAPSLPDSDRTLLSAGAGYRFGNFTADIGYLVTLLAARESTESVFPGNYSGNAHLLGLTLAFRN